MESQKAYYSKRKSVQRAILSVFLIILCGLCILTLILPDSAVSNSERRPLLQFPKYQEMKADAESKGKEYGLSQYFSDLESYLLDQFPARDWFRFLKSIFKLNLLFQKDTNGYYIIDDSLFSMDDEYSEAAVKDAIGRFNAIYNKYFSHLNANVYYSVIPDKNYFAAEKHGYLHYDYDAMYESIKDMIDDNMSEIDIRELLDLDDFYRTDPHWTQNKIFPVADALLSAMGASNVASDYNWTENKLSNYYGTYYGQAALPVAPDDLIYMTSDVLNGVTVYNTLTDSFVGIYDEEKFSNVDPYDVFLQGAVPLLTIKNPNQSNGKQLVLFRDSFGSSIAPLLISEYSEILVIDIRYVSYNFLSSFVEFKPECDVLFLYSTSVLNSYGAFMN
jgi:hypothetical protein